MHPLAAFTHTYLAIHDVFGNFSKPEHLSSQIIKQNFKGKQQLLAPQQLLALSIAVSYSLQYAKHHSNPTLCRSPVEMLNLWKSCILLQFLLYLRYI